MLKKGNDEHNWLGNLKANAFGTEIGDVDRVLNVLNAWAPNRYVKGHMAYMPEIAETFQENKIAKAFIFRDFRDVAVSAAYHAQKEDGGTFPEKEFYQGLSFDECLKRIITGDENIAGVMERWEMFAPWLDEDWVLKIAFEDYIEHQQGVIDLFIRYVYGKMGSYHGINVELDRNDYATMTKQLQSAADDAPSISPTYREAKVGKWKEHFTDEHKELFKETDTNNWLMRLGYEQDDSW